MFYYKKMKEYFEDKLFRRLLSINEFMFDKIK